MQYYIFNTILYHNIFNTLCLFKIPNNRIQLCCNYKFYYENIVIYDII